MPVFVLSFPLQALAGALLGAAHALSFAPWNQGWLQVLALAALFALADSAHSARQAAVAGFAFGLGWFGVGVSWVYISMHVYGGMWAWLAALATLAFAALLALFPALALWAATRFGPSSSLRPLLALPAAWVATEWLRGVVFTGFPWIAGGYAHTDTPLAGFAPVAGVYGLSLLAALVAGALVALLRRQSRAIAAISIALLAAALAGGEALRRIEWTQAAGEPIRVRLVQGNIPQNLKFGPGGLQRAHDTHLKLMRAGARADLVVLPESVFPLPLAYLPDFVTRDLLEYTAARASALVFGVFIEDPPGRYYNSAIGLAPGAQPQRYSKRHLVPFGEFIPFGFRWFVDLMAIPIGDQERGAKYQPPLALAGQRIAVNICYEDLFGAEIIDAWKDPGNAPTLLLNLSNLAWFDDSIALAQHLQISRLRALETGRPMLRATNTGATAIVDARGRVVAQLPFNTEGALDGEVRGHVGTTPYVRFGDWPALAVIAALLLAAFAAGRARRL
ncbi:MAG: apolipoprotein N-acyltransferase [Betaproteobacteria bacterium]|nr:MAG: apolipoprotein N-acyltransferase [Betaproteobacteria bacterium]